MGNPDLSRQQMAASLSGPGGGTGIQAGGEAAAPRAQRHGARLLRGTQRRGTCGAAPPALPGPACRPGSPRLFSTSFPPVRGSEVVSPRLPPWQQQGDSHLPPTAIPRLPYTCPHEGASAPGQCWPPPVCVSRCHGLSYTHLALNNSYHLSLDTRVGVTVLPGAGGARPPRRTTPPCASNLPFPKGGDVRCHREKNVPWGCENK